MRPPRRRPRRNGPPGLLSRLHRWKRGQALTEVALLSPILLLLVAGVGDVGRAFYYKIAVENAAREAAHWATLPFAGDGLSCGAPVATDPCDGDIFAHVASPSQESYGINLGLAPSCHVHDQPPLTPSAVTGACSSGGVSTPALAKGASWLYIYPAVSGRTSMLPAIPGAHWAEVASSSRMVSAPPPAEGGLADVINQVAAGLRPVEALADNNSSRCSTWSSVGAAPGGTSTSPVSISSNPMSGSQQETITVSGIVAANPTDNVVQLQVTSTNPSVTGLQQSWTNTGASTGQVTPGSNTSDTVTLSDLNTLPSGTIQFTVTASSAVNPNRQNQAGACTQTDETANFYWDVPAGPSPSPSPVTTPSPSTAPTALPSPTPLPTPVGGGGPLGREITCTVIYYFSPVTPLSIVSGGIYIVGTATLQATY
jgi:hypothetical protein